ncbi:hypothetical protein [Streptomyces specialis]|uniref:hypothetical protein n=1 Tax=Streptomyces specialis TaxID=498367 RepID=UPI00073F6F79|nr:hypothetical protein [Streptomyces specialis]
MTNDDYTDLEREFSAMLRQTGNGFHHDPQALAESGMRRGRARLWRRRAGVLGGTVSATAIAVGAVYLPGLGDDGQVTAAPPETGQDMIETLTEMLPDSYTVSEVLGAAGPATTADPHVSLVAEDGAGVSFTIDLDLTRWQSEDWRADAGCSVWDEEAGATCDQTELDGGSLLVSRTMDYSAEDLSIGAPDGVPVGDDSMAQRSWGVGLESPSGPAAEAEGFRSVTMTVTAEGTEGAAGVPDVPPVELTLLEEIVQDAVWQRVFDQVDAEYEAPEAYAGWNSSVEPQELLALFRELAPAGLEITDSGDSYPGYAALEVGDGESTALVEINAWAPGSFPDGWSMDDGDLEDPSGMGDAGCEPYATGDESTEVLRCPDPEAGTWMIDVYYADGSSLDITETVEVPAGAGEEAVGPLSLDELTEIGASPEWRALLQD